MAEEKVNLEALLNRAKDQEMQYDWSDAEETYVKVLQSVPNEDFFVTAEILERKAYAQYRASFQVDTNEAFRESVKEALEFYAKAKISYEKTSRPDSKARISRCDSMTSCLEYWQMEKANDKKKSISAAWDHAIEAVNGFKSSHSTLEYARTFIHLWFCAAMLFNYAVDIEGRKKPLINALELGEQAIKFLDGTGEREELAMALVRASILERSIGGWLVDMSDAQKHVRKSFDFWWRAKEGSEGAAFAGPGGVSSV